MSSISSSGHHRIVRVADWHRTPGPRLREIGPWSAEQFMDEVVLPKFDEAVAAGEVLTIDLDGVAGYLASFLEETFGGLSRKYGRDVVEGHLNIVCTHDPYTLEDAWFHVKNPHPPRRPKS